MATTTPNYGWPVPTSTDYVKDGAVAIENLGDAIDATVFANAPGLTLIKSQVIGTAVSSVNVTGAFSATYQNYKILVSGGVGSALALCGMKLGATTSGYYMGQSATNYAGSAALGAVSNGAIFTRMSVVSTTSLAMDFEVQNPFASTYTFVRSTYFDNTITTGAGGVSVGFVDNTTSYSDFTIVPASGTLTGGTIRVYGYKNS